MHAKPILASAAALVLVCGGTAFAQPSSTAPVKADGSPQPGSATGDWNGAHAPTDDKQYSGKVTVTTTAAPPADVSGGATAAPTTGTTTTTSADTTTTSSTATSATTAGTAASFTTSMVTNGPVPDTAANRAKYGQPLSRAGKRTAPRGN